MLDSLLAFDNQLFRLIYSLPHPFWLVAIMEFFSVIGYFGFIWVVLGIYFKKLKLILLALVIVLIVVDVGMKFLVARPRPYPSSLDNFTPWESFSFPSGHAAAAIAAVFILVQLTLEPVSPKKSQKNIKLKFEKIRNSERIQIFLWSLVIIISFSRIYLGRHYPMDVVVGGIIGWGIGYFIVKLT